MIHHPMFNTLIGTYFLLIQNGSPAIFATNNQFYDEVISQCISLIEKRISSLGHFSEYFYPNEKLGKLQ